MNMTTQQRKSKITNQRSTLLSDDENRELFGIVGNRCLALASAVVQVFVAKPPSFNQWSKKCCGVGCFIKDNPKRSYYIRVYDLRSGNAIFEQELYNQFKYKAPRSYFHTFEADDYPVALNFANEDEANAFKNAVNDKLQQRQRKKMERRRTAAQRPPPPAAAAPGPSSVTAINQPALPSMPSNGGGKDTMKKKKEKGKKGKLTKEDIGTPTDFRHVGHVGWDPEKGFDMNNLDPSLKQLFDQVGITASQLEDKDTANFIYDFIDQIGRAHV